MVAERSSLSVPSAAHWIDLIPAPSFLCDASGGVQASNKRSLEFFGLSESELSQPTIIGLLSTASVDDYLDQWNHRMTPLVNDTTLRSLHVRSASGTLVSARLSIGSLIGSGQQLFLLVFGDPEKDRHTAAKDVITMAQHLSAVRHNFRNPLAGIIVMTDVLLRNTDKNLSTKQIERLTGVRESLRRMAEMIHEIDVVNP